MSKNSTFTLLIVLFLFSFISVNSQTFKTEKIPLGIVLKALEKRFDIRFTYADKTIEGVEITEPSMLLSYNDAITYLRTNTNLNFKIINTECNKLHTNFIGNNAFFKVSFLCKPAIHKPFIAKPA